MRAEIEHSGQERAGADKGIEQAREGKQGRESRGEGGEEGEQRRGR